MGVEDMQRKWKGNIGGASSGTGQSLTFYLGGGGSILAKVNLRADW